MKDKFGIVTLVSLLIAFIGVIVPIAWDYYSGKKGISLTLVSHNNVISPAADVEGLEISYKGTELSTLSRTTFLIENTGSRPILESDVITPIKIKIAQRANVLDAIIDSKYPQNLDFYVTKDSQEVTIKFSLMNPEDKAFISLLIDSKEIEFEASTRIAGIKELNVNHNPPKTLTVWAFVWIPVGLLSILLILVAFIGFFHYPKEVKVKRSLKSNQFMVPEFKTYEDAHSWVEKSFDFITNNDRAPIFQRLKELEEDGAGFDKKVIYKVVRNSVLNSQSNLIMGLIVFGIGVFGVYYSIGSLGFLT